MAKKAKRYTRRGRPLAAGYTAVVTFNADVSGEKYWNTRTASDMRDVLRQAKRLVRDELDGIVDAPRATIDLHLGDHRGKLVQQFETHQTKGSGFIRFRTLEV